MVNTLYMIRAAIEINASSAFNASDHTESKSMHIYQFLKPTHRAKFSLYSILNSSCGYQYIPAPANSLNEAQIPRWCISHPIILPWPLRT